MYLSQKHNWVELVSEFQKKFERYNPDIVGQTLLRAKLLKEEFNEYCDAIEAFGKTMAFVSQKAKENPNAEQYDELKERLDTALIEKLDALGDMIYIIIGTANLFGMDIDEAVHRIHLSNMSKLGEDGKPIYNSNGKVMKGPNYFKPKLDDLVDILAGLVYAQKFENSSVSGFNEEKCECCKEDADESCGHCCEEKVN